MKLVDFFKKFWVPGKYDDVNDFYFLPKLNLVDYVLPAIKQIRPYTVEIYNIDEAKPKLIIKDDGNGNLVPQESYILSNVTGVAHTINYTNYKINLTWDIYYLANSLVNEPKIEIKYYSENNQEHIEMVDMLASIFGDYKTQELDAQKYYYNPKKIDDHQIETLAKEHNWILDRYYSEADSYLRSQLDNLYNIYKSKRKLDGVFYAIAVIRKRVKLYNYLAKKGVTEGERKTNYEDMTSWARFNTDDLIKSIEDPGLTEPQIEVLSQQIEDIYSYLYSSVCEYYPIKHFLLDLALDVINEDGSLLNPKDLKALKNYIYKIKSKSQFPHFTTSLNLNALVSLVEQDGLPFDFRLFPEELAFFINNYETLNAGPNGVFSRAITGTGAWETLPLIMNEGHFMNEGLFMNMSLPDIPSYITSFKVGIGAHTILTNDLTDLDVPVYEGTLIKYTNDTTYSYYTCLIENAYANDLDLTEFGLFNHIGQLGFYAKFPKIVKLNNHSLTIRIKIAG